MNDSSSLDDCGGPGCVFVFVCVCGGGGHLQSDNEGVGHLRQHLLLIVDVLLLFQPDHVRDFHLF